MIRRIILEQLYDKYDYDIQISEAQPVTILTGPNGYGKTTILKVINHLFACNFWYFFLLRFKTLTFHFRDGKQMIISKKIEYRDHDTKREDHSSVIVESVNFQFLDKEEKRIETFDIKNTDLLHWEQQMLINRRSNIRDINDNYKEEFYCDNFQNIDYTTLMNKSKYTRMFMQEYSCDFIKEQRLIRPVVVEDHRFYREATLKNEVIVENIANDLHTEFFKIQQIFAITSQETDATFIKRLIENPHKSYSETEFRDILNDLKTRMDNFSKYGLAPKDELLDEYPEEEEQRKVLSLYIDDIRKKLSCYDSFYKQLSMFDNFIVSKTLSDKRIELNSNKGIVVYDDLNQEIPLSKLSSGEQHLIILYYKLSFELNSRSLLLIDEPENSLHPAWQRQMLEDYLKMAEELGCQIIIATHSPIFINDRWDIAFDLFDNKKK